MARPTDAPNPRIPWFVLAALLGTFSGIFATTFNRQREMASAMAHAPPVVRAAAARQPPQPDEPVDAAGLVHEVESLGWSLLRALGHGAS